MAHNLQQEISLRQNKVSKVLKGVVTAVLSHINVRDLNYANDTRKMEEWEKKMQELIGGYRANYANEDNFNAILAEIEQLRDHDSSHFFAPHFDRATGRMTHEIQVIFTPLKVLKKVEEASRKNIYGSGLNLGLPETSNSLSQRHRIGYRQASMRKIRTFGPARDGGLHI